MSINNDIELDNETVTDVKHMINTSIESDIKYDTRSRKIYGRASITTEIIIHILSVAAAICSSIAGHFNISTLAFIVTAMNVGINCFFVLHKYCQTIYDKRTTQLNTLLTKIDIDKVDIGKANISSK